MRRLLPIVLVCVAASGYAAPPELPQILIDTTYSAPTGTTTTVASGANLQTAIDNAACGDILSLEAGATFTGNYTLPDKDCTEWIYIQSSAYASLPSPGTRVAIADASDMPKLTNSTTGAVITSASDADHYRFVGIEFESKASSQTDTFIALSGGMGNLATQTNNIVFDRCYIHGNATAGQVKHGISANGAYISVIDSYLSDIKWAGQDNQAWWSYNGSGPFKLVNNFIEGAGENIMTGGADSSATAFMPRDIEIRRNHFFKRLEWKADDPSWDGSNWLIKNLLELKAAERVLIENNFFEHSWTDGQTGIGILFSNQNQDGNAPWNTVSDVTFRGNWIHGVNGCMTVIGWGANDPVESERIAITHNLCSDQGGASWGGGTIRPWWMSATTYDMTLQHNTVTDASGSALMLLYGVGLDHVNMTYAYNIGPRNTYGVQGDGECCEGNVSIAQYMPSGVFTGNIIRGGVAATYNAYAGNYFPADDAAIGYENHAGGDYRLDSASTYYGVGPGGADLGAWIPAAITASNQLDWRLSLEADYTSVIVTFGVPGLPADQACTVRYGDQTVASNSGASTRQVVISGLTPDQEYFIGVDCGATWGGWLSWDNYTATAEPGGATNTLTYSVRPPALLSTVARVLAECSTVEAMTDPVSGQDTTCTSAADCSVGLVVPLGANYCRHTYQTSGDVAVAVSKPQLVTVQ